MSAVRDWPVEIAVTEGVETAKICSDSIMMIGFGIWSVRC
jgi:hypothetical protein